MKGDAVSLFHPGRFWSHSGRPLEFKIEANCLTESDLDLFAKLIATRLWSRERPVISRVIGVPKGQPGGRDNGGLLAQYVRRHMTVYEELRGWTLIVDDVLTTGASMEIVRESLGDPPPACLGAVIFARGPCPHWIRPVFTLNEACW